MRTICFSSNDHVLIYCDNANMQYVDRSLAGEALLQQPAICPHKIVFVETMNSDCIYIINANIPKLFSQNKVIMHISMLVIKLIRTCRYKSNKNCIIYHLFIINVISCSNICLCLFTEYFLVFEYKCMHLFSKNITACAFMRGDTVLELAHQN